MTVRDKYGTIDSFTQVIREYSEYIREDEADIEYIREKEKGGVQAIHCLMMKLLQIHIYLI